MVDYWVSNPKKFCDFCKCWIADNKPSIQFHERGKNHQENVRKRLVEVKRKSTIKRQKDEDFKNEFAAMEAAALQAVKKDLKNDPSLMGTSDLNTLIKDSNQSSTPYQSSTPPSQKVSSDQPWMICEAQGHKYYYNTVTGESTWEVPEYFKKSSLSTESDSAENASTSESTKVKTEEVDEHEKQEESKEELKEDTKEELKEELKEEIKEEIPDEIQEETHKHPLLGGWTRVACSPAVKEEEDDTENTSNISTNEQETYNKSDTTNPEPRTTGRKFKEKKVTLSASPGNEGENVVAFKKRKFGGARNARRRFDDS